MDEDKFEVLRDVEDLLSITGGRRSTDNSPVKIEKSREPKVNPPEDTKFRRLIMLIGNATLCSW